MTTRQESSGTDHFDLARLADDVRAGDRAALARAITLVESRRPDHRHAAAALLKELMPETGRAIRLGLTGSPGVGKSTLIDRLGSQLIAAGHRVAVLAIDPSSNISGGAILGDKTRMAALARSDQAFIRPSPTAGTLGGIAARTREAMLLCEAAGYDVVVVETVGVGQSEVAVADLVDFFLVLVEPGAGDALQGLKKGVIELADLIAVNKADGPNRAPAERTAAEYRTALGLLAPKSPHWRAEVMTVSAREGRGLDALWQRIEAHHEVMRKTGALDDQRRRQAIGWMRKRLEERLFEYLRHDPRLAPKVAELEDRVGAGAMTPDEAVARIAKALGLDDDAPRPDG